MYKWFLAWRYLHTKVIAFLGVVSVTLCVAMVLVVMSVMGGFLDTIRVRSRGLHADVVIEGWTLQGFPYYDSFADYLVDRHPDLVELSTPVIYTYGIFRVPESKFTKPARVVGIRLDEYTRVNSFRSGLCYDQFFPGTTTLKPQKIALAGITAGNRLRLPSNLERANEAWRNRVDADQIAQFDSERIARTFYPELTAEVPGHWVFAAAPGEPRYVGPELPGVIVGCDLLNYRRPDGNFDRSVARGANVALTLLPLSVEGNATGEPPMSVPLRYADDSRTGIYEIDSLCVYVDFDMVQHKLAMDRQPRVDGGFTRSRTNQLLVQLKSGVPLNEGHRQVREAWTDFLLSIDSRLENYERRVLGLVDVLTWEDLQRPFIAAVEKERVLMIIILCIICLVAIVLLALIFYMIVEKKTRDIGILKAIGASSRGVAALFVVYAAAIGIVGSVIGLTVGTLFVWNINDIQDFLASLNPALRVWSPDVYSFDRIPEVVRRVDAVWVAVVAVMSSVVGSLIPAAIAGRVWPVRALRYE